MSEQSCGNCRFYRAAFDDKGDISLVLGFCRRNAPRPGDQWDVCWPGTHSSEWCGEWQPVATAQMVVDERLQAAVVQEREACIRDAWSVAPVNGWSYPQALEAAIKKRTEKP